MFTVDFDEDPLLTVPTSDGDCGIILRQRADGVVRCRPKASGAVFRGDRGGDGEVRGAACVFLAVSMFGR